MRKKQLIPDGHQDLSASESSIHRLKLVNFEPNRSELEYFGGLDGLGLTVMTSLYTIRIMILRCII